MESLYEKTALIVQKSEQLDPEDSSINYEVTMIVDARHGELKHFHTSFMMRTDDKSLYEKFLVGKETDLKFLEAISSKVFKMDHVKKAN